MLEKIKKLAQEGHINQEAEKNLVEWLGLKLRRIQFHNLRASTYLKFPALTTLIFETTSRIPKKPLDVFHPVPQTVIKGMEIVALTSQQLVILYLKI